MAVVSFEDVELYPSDICLFDNGNWLNDSCVLFGLRRIERHLEEFWKTEMLLMDPCVVSFLRIQCHEPEEYKEIYESLCIREKSWIFLPLTNSESFEKISTHWSLLVVHIPGGTVYHFDSSFLLNQSAASHYIKCLEKLLNMELNLENKMICPQQDNTYDCGIFVLCFIKYLCEKLMQEEPKDEIISKSYLEEAVVHVTPQLAEKYRISLAQDIQELSKS